jgi:cyclopropane-fatty-acyl-phospholipid synthase
LADPIFPSIEKWILRRIQNSVGDAPIKLVLGKNQATLVSRSEPVASVLIPDYGTLARLVFNPEMTFGDAYSAGRIEVEGDLVRFLETVIRSMNTVARRGWTSRLSSWWLKHIQANTRNGSRKNIHHHYDLNTDFYKLWLDSRLVYTCAYFSSPSMTLEDAQLAKMDYVCRKVHLWPGEKVVEAGCGWGSLSLYMAKNYGANVKAFNVSREQILYAREQAKKEGLEHQVEFIEDDYRNISGKFDAFVSVGMLEHVGKENYGELGRIIHRSIGDSGRGLLHFIGRNQPGAFSPWIRKRIFPGAYVPALGEVMEIFERWDYSVRDAENLRMHYAKTLEHWLDRFEQSAKQISEIYSPEFVRAWRLYLAGSLAAFNVGNLQLFQLVFAGPGCTRIPWTRDRLYLEEPRAKEESRWTPVTS